MMPPQLLILATPVYRGSVAMRSGYARLSLELTTATSATISIQ